MSTDRIGDESQGLLRDLCVVFIPSAESPPNVSSLSPRTSEGVSRRDFLRVGGLFGIGLSADRARAEADAERRPAHKQCLFLLLNGGPSQIDTFDPKPQAPADYRGPFAPISTSIPGLAFSELLPETAVRADRLTIIRSMCSDAAAVHEGAQQLLATGRQSHGGRRFPSLGAWVAAASALESGTPAPTALFPEVVAETKFPMWRGQTAGDLGSDYDPVIHHIDGGSLPEGLGLRGGAGAVAGYTRSRFGRACGAAVDLLERGTRFVTVNMFPSLENQPSWDCHGSTAPTRCTLQDYRHSVCPDFDFAFSAVLDDLSDRGMMDDTLVVAAGEFGRAPRMNGMDGRDHWANAWTVLLAGAGLPQGLVYGATDHLGRFVADRPVHPGELAATLLTVLGVDPTKPVKTAAGADLEGLTACPVAELVPVPAAAPA